MIDKEKPFIPRNAKLRHKKLLQLYTDINHFFDG